jgi:hypothetical protein
MAEKSQSEEPQGSGLLASGSLEEMWTDIVVFHADGTSTDYGTVSRTNFKEQAEVLAHAHQDQDKNILKRISSRLKGKESNG